MTGKGPRILAGLAAAVAFLSGCGEKQVAGGYDDVENPSIRVALIDNAGGPAGDAIVRLYARYQNPLQDSMPVLALPAIDTLRIRDSAVLEAFRLARERGIQTPSPDTLGFNLMAYSDDGEAFLNGFLLVRNGSGWSFRRRSGAMIAYPDARGVLSTSPVMDAPVFGQRGTVGDKGMELGLKQVFIPGSPYFADLDSNGAFIISRIAAGRYELKALSADEKVYTASDSLRTGAEYVPQDWSEAELIWVAP